MEIEIMGMFIDKRFLALGVAIVMGLIYGVHLALNRQPFYVIVLKVVTYSFFCSSNRNYPSGQHGRHQVTASGKLLQFLPVTNTGVLVRPQHTVLSF